MEDRLPGELLKIAGVTFDAQWVQANLSVLMLLHGWFLTEARKGDTASIYRMADWLRCCAVEAAAMLRETDVKSWGPTKGGIN